MKTYYFLFLFLTGVVINGCSGDGATGGNDNASPAIEKSKKRGIAYNLTDAADMETFKSGVSWWYNWYMITGAPAEYYTTYQMAFIPMLWGGNNATDFIVVKNFILNHPEVKYLLVLNEPNLTDQANQTPAQAAAEWIKYENLLNDPALQQREVILVGPAMTWGTMNNYWDPVVWLDAFYDAYRSANNGNDPRIDYLAFHWYDYGLAAQLDRLKKYGKQIWITEMANWNPQINSYAKQKEQMQAMVQICESREDVFRYAWFIGRGALPDDHFTYLLNPTPGELSDLGEYYLSLPYTD